MKKLLILAIALASASAMASESLYFRYCSSYGNNNVRFQVGSAGVAGVGQRALGVLYGTDNIFHSPEEPSQTNFTIFKTPINDPSIVARTGSLIDFAVYANLSIDKGPDESKRLGTISIYRDPSNKLNGIFKAYNGSVLNFINCTLTDDSYSPAPWEP